MGLSNSERGLDPDQRDHVGAKPIPVERQDDVGEAEDRVAPEVHAPAEREVVGAGPLPLEAEDGRREPLPGAGGDAGDVEEARRGDALEGLAAEKGHGRREAFLDRAVEPEAEASRALVDGAAVQLDAAVRVRLQADSVPERERRRRCVEHGRRLPRTRALEVVLVAGARSTRPAARSPHAPCSRRYLPRRKISPGPVLEERTWARCSWPVWLSRRI